MARLRMLCTTIVSAATFTIVAVLIAVSGSASARVAPVGITTGATPTVSTTTVAGGVPAGLELVARRR